MKEKRLFWIGSSKKDLTTFPEEVKRVFGYALHLAQIGRKHPHAKPLKGYHGAKVMEIVADERGDAYRAVYTVEFESEVYALHCFQKKSKRGVSTPKPDMDLIQSRMKIAKALHDEWLKRMNNEPT